MRILLPILAALIAVTSLARAADSPPSADELDFFEKKIRPVLATSCYECHSATGKSLKGGLALDTREGTRRGGNSGPAVVPGNLAESLLIQAVRYASADMAMPPRKNGGKLPESAIRDLEAWVKMGAPDPRSADPETHATALAADYTEALKWWAWQLPKSPAVPAVTGKWARGAIDAFVQQGMAQHGLQPVADADPAALLRRVYFDLIGLPPRPSEVADFLRKCSPGPDGSPVVRTEVLATVVDALLATPQFGEHWGRHWLDVARYAESSGKDVNASFPHAWRYRDYVVAAFNGDKSYAEFLLEQVAGDLLPAESAQEKAEHLIATGFLALGTKGLNEQNARQYALDVADEQLDTLGQAVLGTTIGCARCHDHKFDPISQKDYYALAGIFLSTSTHIGTARGIQNRHATQLLELPVGCGELAAASKLTSAAVQAKQAELASLEAERRGFFREARAPQNTTGSQQQQRLRNIIRSGQLEVELASYDGAGNPKLLAMGLSDNGREPRSATAGQGVFQRRFSKPREFSGIQDAALYIRGEAEKPGEIVPRGFPAALTKGAAPSISGAGSGRKELADWLVSPANPLTARVMVNRVWSWLMGRGIVESVDNFGTTGKLPTHPELLDLAVHFSAKGWSVKQLVREIMLSRTYGLSSQHEAGNFQKDPDNAYCWRHAGRRLDAESLRDAMLCVSGELDLRPLVGSVVALAGDFIIGGPVGPRRGEAVTEEQLHGAGGNHRSLYLPIARDQVPDALAVFDFAEPSLVSGKRDVTNVPSQALYLLNSDFVAVQAEKFAKKIREAYADSKTRGEGQLLERLPWIYQLCFSRQPTSIEVEAAQAFFRSYPAENGATSAVESPAAWTSFCRALFGTAEFRLLE
jgi:cytochrome c553